MGGISFSCISCIFGCSAAEKGIHSNKKYYRDIWSVHLCAHVFKLGITVDSLCEVPRVASRNMFAVASMAWCGINWMTQGRGTVISNGIWTLGKSCHGEYEVAVFPFLARQQAVCITVQKLLCRREKSLRHVAMYCFISLKQIRNVHKRMYSQQPSGTSCC